MADNARDGRVMVFNIEYPKAFPFGEGGFFIAPRAMKKTEEVMTQYGFAAGYR